MHTVWQQTCAALLGLGGATSALTLQQDALIGSSFGVPTINRTFDYIVIGGGTGGLAVASRLSQDQNHTVAVVEAGSFYEITNGNYSQVPGYDTQWSSSSPEPSTFNPLIDWGIVTTPQEQAYGFASHYARGKCLGGSSARNYMIFQRGTKGSYQKWADMVGDQSYTFDNLLPYFERSMNFTPPDNTKRGANSTPTYDTSVLGYGGPVDATYPNYAGPWGTWAELGMRELGIGPIPGFMSGELIGGSHGLYSVNHTTGIRESSETAFLRPQLGVTPGLQVYTDTLAKQILFNGTVASGVLVESGGFQYKLSANKEVILSAGAFQSPQLLLVSGVGPAETLNKFDIPIIADRPGVGQNMWDHVLFGPSHHVDVLTTSALTYNQSYRQEAIADFNRDGSGPLASPGGDFIGWEKVPASLSSDFTAETQQALSYFPDDWPDFELIASPAFSGNVPIYPKAAPMDGYNYASIYMALVSPSSRGNVTIKSTDTNDLPVVDPNWLADPADKQVAIAGFKRARQLFETQAVQPVLIGSEYFPGANVSSTNDTDIYEFIRKSYHTVYHASCTNSMGKPDDPMAVVDSRARVIGVQGLRVVDASAFPLLPPGHPQASVYMLAEKISDDMLASAQASG